MTEHRYEVEVVWSGATTVTKDAMILTARQLHTEAHRRCFLANSVNFPVRHQPTVLAA